MPSPYVDPTVRLGGSDPGGLATCRWCKRPMRPGVSCQPFVFVVESARGLHDYPRQPYAPEPYMSPDCNDCATPAGGYHHVGCDMDRCEHGQALGCEWCTVLAVSELVL